MEEKLSAQNDEKEDEKEKDTAPEQTLQGGVKLSESENAKKQTPRRRAAFFLARAGIGVALMCVCAQISIPLPPPQPPITLQTLAVIICAAALTPLETLAATSVYVLMGLCGIPVFSGFKATGALFGPTGGFIIGFVPSGIMLSLCVSLIEKKSGTKKIKYLFYCLASIASSCILYIFGGVYFMLLLKSTFIRAMAVCVLPFLLGNAIKIAIATLAYGKIVKIRKMR